MNDTTEASTSESKVPPYQQLDRLRRSRDDRYVAGVAGGLGRHFGIDPVLIRVLLAVLTVFGGAGVLVYVACWLFVPEEGSDRAVIELGGEPRRIVLMVAVAVAFLAAIGDAFSGFNTGWPIATVAVILAVVLIARDRRGKPGPFEPQSAAAGTTAVETAPGVPPARPAGRPQRSGIVLFWPTLALIAIGLGVLGLIDSGHSVAPAAYPALALAITGVMLLIGSVVGRPGGLILIGLLSSAALAVVGVVGGVDLATHRLELAPHSAAEVQSSYRIHNGEITLDLTGLTDPQQLAGRTITVAVRAGQVRVLLPAGLAANVDARVSILGGIKLPGYDGGGFGTSVLRHLGGTTSTQPVTLDLSARVGQITVEQQ